MDTEKNTLNIYEFVNLLAGSDPAGIVDVPVNIDKAREEGWLEEWDELHGNDPVLRRDAARILHMYMLKVMKESDTSDTAEAMKLRDIYDCRVCAGHIAQVYSKGIMNAFFFQDGFSIFDNSRTVDMAEAKEIINRLFNRSSRLLA